MASHFFNGVRDKMVDEMFERMPVEWTDIGDGVSAHVIGDRAVIVRFGFLHIGMGVSVPAFSVEFPVAHSLDRVVQCHDLVGAKASAERVICSLRRLLL